MSVETVPRAENSRSQDRLTEDDLTILENPDATISPEQEVVRVEAANTLRDNPELQHEIDASLQSHLDLALSDNRELEKANKKADRSFLAYEEMSPITFKAGIKRGRAPLREKAEKAKNKATKYDKLRLEEEERARKDPNVHGIFTNKSRRLARKAIRQQRKGKRLQGKIDYLTNTIANEPLKRWEQENNPVRNTEGYSTLKEDLAKIQPELTRRKTLRLGVEELEKGIDAGTIRPNTPLYAQYLERKREIESWNETDEEVTERMKAEAIAKYREWLDESGREEKEKNYKKAEERINQRLDAEAQANDPNTPEADRKTLKEQLSQLAPLREFGARLVRGDVQGFADWIEKDANRELIEAIDKIGQNANKQFLEEMKELGDTLEEYKKLLEKGEWYEQQMTNAPSDEEKARWQHLVNENDADLAKLKQKMDHTYEKIEAERLEDEAYAEHAARKRMGVAELWQDDSQKSS